MRRLHYIASTGVNSTPQGKPYEEKRRVVGPGEIAGKKSFIDGSWVGESLIKKLLLGGSLLLEESFPEKLNVRAGMGGHS